MKRNSPIFFEDRFGREKDPENYSEKNQPIASENEKSEKNSNPTELADICNICKKFTWNIYRHIKYSHPFVYQKMME